MWNKAKYEEYKQSVERNLVGLSFISTGICPGCPDCPSIVVEAHDEPHFSWSACEGCGSTLGGDRHRAHGRAENNAIVHFEVCVDCLYYLNYGKLDDTSMLEVEAS
jgi:hypothetical protein